MKKRWVLAVIFGGVFLFTAVEWAIGMVIDPRIETLLTDLFGMPVTVQRLRINPFLGKIWAARLTFMDQPEFAVRPHLDVKGVKFRVDLWALKEKKIKIETLFLNKAFYFIDRIATPDGPKNNAKTWFYHIKKKKKEKEKKQRVPSGDDSDWVIEIDKIEIKDGTFIVHDRAHQEREKKFFFQKLDVTLENFRWPTPDREVLSQKVRFRGTFGEDYPAPFWIEGNANFAQSEISFDATGKVDGGRVTDYPWIWEGLPIQITDGWFDLKSHFVCIHEKVKSDNELVMKSLKMKPREGATDKMWGYPLKAWMGFLQEQQSLALKVHVQGDIDDPQFGFNSAFRKAFQKALRKRTESSIKLFGAGAEMLATQTQQIVAGTPKAVLNTPNTIVTGLEKLTSFTKSENNPEAKEEEK